jgi:hypothetical protein
MQPDYVMEEEFVDADQGVLVRLYRNKAMRNPTMAWSIRPFTIIRGREKEFTIPGIAVDLQRPSFNRIDVGRRRGQALAELIARAEERAVELAQQDTDRNVEERVDRDHEFAQRGKPKTRHTGKTARDRAKRANRT